MARFVLRRIVTMILALWLIITLTFVIMHSVPGGPFSSERKAPPAVLENLNARYQLNDPYWKQYVDYFSNIARGDLGPSFKYDRTVNEIISEGFPVSAALGAVALSFSLGAGILLGTLAAWKHKSWLDYSAMLLAALGFSVPGFILGGLLMYVFAYELMWLPPAMWGGWRHVVMPALALSALPMAYIARLMRSGLLEVLRQEYISTARAKGLSYGYILVHHAFKNALLPVITILGPLAAAVFTGSFAVESIFAVPGLGRYFVVSVMNRDYTLILGLTVFYSAFLLVMNFIVDLFYFLLDPRIRPAGDGGG